MVMPRKRGVTLTGAHSLLTRFERALANPFWGCGRSCMSAADDWFCKHFGYRCHMAIAAQPVEAVLHNHSFAQSNHENSVSAAHPSAALSPGTQQC